MRRLQQVGSLAFLCFALFMMSEASKLVYFTRLGPGPGFFPFWIGGILAVLSGNQFLQATTSPNEPLPPGLVPGRQGVLRVLAIVAAIAIFGLLVKIVGFQLLMLVFLLFLLYALGRQNLPITVVVSLLGSFGQFYLFRHLLDVELPLSSIDFLHNLGL